MTIGLKIENTDTTRSIRITCVNPSTGESAGLSYPVYEVGPKQTSPLVYIHSGVSVKVDELETP